MYLQILRTKQNKKERKWESAKKTLNSQESIFTIISGYRSMLTSFDWICLTSVPSPKAVIVTKTRNREKLSLFSHFLFWPGCWDTIQHCLQYGTQTGSHATSKLHHHMSTPELLWTTSRATFLK